jgi:DNA-binding PadR family transcriptional regulator
VKLKVLSNQDEILMLAIRALGKEAYGVTIRRHVSKITGKDWSIGAIYDPLYRLEKKEFVKSELSQPTNERGGRSKRIFSITETGIKALYEHRNVRDLLWDNIEDVELDSI